MLILGNQLNERGKKAKKEKEKKKHLIIMNQILLFKMITNNENKAYCDG